MISVVKRTLLGVSLSIWGFLAVPQAGAEGPVVSTLARPRASFDRDLATGMPVGAVVAGKTAGPASEQNTELSTSTDVVSMLPVPAAPPDPERTRRYLAPAT